MASEVPRYRKLLGAVQKAATDQPWSKERPWRTSTHVGEEHGVVVVDLHDLKAALAKRAVKLCLDATPPKAGALVFVHGQGRRSRAPGGVLRGIVVDVVGQAARKQPGWAVRPGRPGRSVWVTDRKKAPKSIIGGGGVGFTVGIVLFVSLFLFALLNRLGVLPSDFLP